MGPDNGCSGERRCARLVGEVVAAMDADDLFNSYVAAAKKMGLDYVERTKGAGGATREFACWKPGLPAFWIDDATFEWNVHGGKMLAVEAAVELLSEFRKEVAEVQRRPPGDWTLVECTSDSRVCKVTLACFRGTDNQIILEYNQRDAATASAKLTEISKWMKKVTL